MAGITGMMKSKILLKEEINFCSAGILKLNNPILLKSCTIYMFRKPQIVSFTKMK